MSQQNMEVVLRWFDKRAQWTPLSATPDEVAAAVSEIFDAVGDYYPVGKFPEARPCHGPEELAQFLVQFAEAFSRYDWAIRWLTAVGDDRVLACAHLRAEGRGSGLGLEGDMYECFWLRHGRFFRVEDHLTLSGALHALGLEGETLEAAGLSEQDPPEV